MALFIDNNFPHILGAELHRPHPAYIMESIADVAVVHDANKVPGESVQLDRYAFWGGNGLTARSRMRDDSQTIGTGNGRDIPKDIVTITLREFTGPAAPHNPNIPGCFQIPVRKALHAQRMLWGDVPLLNPQGSRIQAFHNSIGSVTLLDDYRRWRDSVFINEFLKTENTYNPSGVPDGVSYGAGSTRNGDGRISIDDTMKISEDLNVRQAPQFSDPDLCYRACVSDRFMRHLRQDPNFREVARYPGPNSLIFGGLHFQQPTAYGQSAAISPPGMAAGVRFEGIHYWKSNNLPTELIKIGFADVNGGTVGPLTAHIGIFFGPQAVGMAVGGNGPSVLVNQNDDFGRFIIVIWSLYAGWEVLNQDFITIARTFAD